MNLIDRMLAPTPRFFRRLRNAGLTLTAASGAVLASPVVLPTLLVSIAGYCAVGGGVLSAVSQITVDEQPPLATAPAVKAAIGSPAKAKRKKATV